MNKEQIRKAKNEVNRADLARQVLDNSVYREAFMVLKAQIMEDFTRTNFKQSEERDELWRKMQTLDRVESYIKDVMITGKLAKQSLTAFEKAKNLVGL